MNQQPMKEQLMKPLHLKEQAQLKEVVLLQEF